MAGMLVLVGGQMLAGAYHPGKYFALHLFLGSQFAYLLGLMSLLDRSAAAALETFRPVLDLPRRSKEGPADKGSSLEELRYRLTTLPPWPTLWASLAGMLLGVVVPLLVFRPPGTTAFSLMAAFAWGRMSTSLGASRFLDQMAFSRLSPASLSTTRSISSGISRIYLTRPSEPVPTAASAFSVPAAIAPAQPISIVLGSSSCVGRDLRGRCSDPWPAGRERRRASARRFEAAVTELHQRVTRRP
jgi:hypothetical protein